jgi:hypothetical protein
VARRSIVALFLDWLETEGHVPSRSQGLES